MKTLALILGISFLLLGCEKDENDREPNTYTIEGYYLQNCSTAWENVNLRFRIIRGYTFSVDVDVVGNTTTDENGYYKMEYQDPKEFKRSDAGELQIDYSFPTNPDRYYTVTDGIRPHQNRTLDYVTQPNDTAFFRTIGGASLTSSDTLFFEHETQRLRYVVGPINDAIPFDTLIYRGNFGRQTITWSIGINNVNTMRERNRNYGNYGSTVYQRNNCSSVENLIDLSNAKYIKQL